MLHVRSERFLPSGVTFRLPMFAADHLVMTGLTAPQWRLALAMLCRMDDRGVVTMEKPKLEQLSGVTLNTVEALISPLMHSTIDMPGDELHGEDVFESIEYQPGKKGQSVGLIRATRSIAMGHLFARGRVRTVPLPADEMRRYRGVPAMILRLRLGAIMERESESARVAITVTGEGVSELFGAYARTAFVKRPSAVTGEIVEHMSLARAGAILVMPAVEEIAEISSAMRTAADVNMAGRKWASIEITATRLKRRQLAPKPKPRVTATRTLMTRGRPTRAVVKTAG